MTTTEPTRIEATDAEDARLEWIGGDDTGVELEITAIDLPDYLLVIHVMPHRAEEEPMSERYVFDPDDEDVDLDVEDVRLKDGRRLTKELAERIAEETYQSVRGPGRPSLSGEQEVSPVVSFRIPEQLRTVAKQRARQEGRSVSELARDALADYLRG